MLDNSAKNRYISAKFKGKFLFCHPMEWTLLLNSTFEPLKVITWKKAVIMVMLEKVEVLQEYERFIRGVTFALRLPAVIRLNRFIKRRTPL